MALWAVLIAASIVLIVMGLWRTAFFIYAPEPAMIEKARVGALYVLAGSASSLAAVGLSAFLGHDFRVSGHGRSFGIGMYQNTGLDFFSLGLGQTVAFYDVEDTGELLSALDQARVR